MRAFIASMAIITLFVFSSPSFADYYRYKKPFEPYWSIGGTLGYASFKKEAVNEKGLKSSAFVGGIDGQIVTENYITSIGLEGLSYSNSDDYPVQSSESTPLLLSLAFGRRWQKMSNREFRFYSQFGFTKIHDAKKTFRECSTCSESTVWLDGGVYINLRVDYSLPNYTLGLEVQKYQMGDFSNIIRLKLHASL